MLRKGKTGLGEAAFPDEMALFENSNNSLTWFDDAAAKAERRPCLPSQPS
jgi:hypothetical protein